MQITGRHSVSTIEKFLADIIKLENANEQNNHIKTKKKNDIRQKTPLQHLFG